MTACMDMREKDMQRRIIALLGCLVILAFSGGCVENPEGDIIANKNEGVFEEKLKEQNVGNGQEQMDSYQDAFDVKKDGLHVSIYPLRKYILPFAIMQSPGCRTRS